MFLARFFAFLVFGAWLIWAWLHVAWLPWLGVCPSRCWLGDGTMVLYRSQQFDDNTEKKSKQRRTKNKVHSFPVLFVRSSQFVCCCFGRLSSRWWYTCTGQAAKLDSPTMPGSPSVIDENSSGGTPILPFEAIAVVVVVVVAFLLATFFARRSGTAKAGASDNGNNNSESVVRIKVVVGCASPFTCCSIVLPMIPFVL